MRVVALLFAALQAAAGQGTGAYVNSGDLWLKALPAGEPKRLTRGGGFHRPRWSASGRWLSARHGERLWLSRSSGEGAREIAAGEAQWSPASDELAYINESGPLRILDVATGREREVTPRAVAVQSKAAAVQWSLDGRSLAFLHPDTGALWLVGSDGAGAHEIFHPEAFLRLAGWSAAGQILFWHPPENSASVLADGVALEAIPVSGGAPRRLSTSVLPYRDFVSFSPDGRFAAIVDGPARDSWSEKRVVIVNLADGTRRFLTEPSFAALFPAWSPDGKTIAYAAGPDYRLRRQDHRVAVSERRLWLAEVSGGTKRPFTFDSRYRDERPQWSADGRWVLFARISQDDRASLWMVRPDTGELREVVEAIDLKGGWFGFYGHTDWSDALDWRR